MFPHSAGRRRIELLAPLCLFCSAMSVFAGSSIRNMAGNIMDATEAPAPKAIATAANHGVGDQSSTQSTAAMNRVQNMKTMMDQALLLENRDV